MNDRDRLAALALSRVVLDTRDAYGCYRMESGTRTPVRGQTLQDDGTFTPFVTPTQPDYFGFDLWCLDGDDPATASLVEFSDHNRVGAWIAVATQSAAGLAEFLRDALGEIERLQDDLVAMARANQKLRRQLGETPRGGP